MLRGAESARKKNAAAAAAVSAGAKTNVSVVVRCRPLSAAETADGKTAIVKCTKEGVSLKGKLYGPFDQVYPPTASQLDVYKTTGAPQVLSALSGFNCTLFAYGQTGTGKTHTMEGAFNPGVASWQDDVSAGLVPRAARHIFEELQIRGVEEYVVRVSYLELYNEDLTDLLVNAAASDGKRLRIFDDPAKKGSVVVSGAEEVPVRSVEEVQRLLQQGSERRATAATLMNNRSSRSHTIFTISVMIRENMPSGEEVVKQGKLNLVDLAGSENIGRSGADGQRAKEAGMINQSLLTLGRVINALTSGAPHVPYRESKLTRLLQDSLGGSTLTTIIATLSPSSCSYDETVSTLEYASRAKNIKNTPEVNQKLSKKHILKEYSQELERLMRDLHAAREKNGITLSQESYDGMVRAQEEHEREKEQLEEQISATFERMQQVMEDMALMNEQYEALYGRSQRLESKLATRVDELDSAKFRAAINEHALELACDLGQAIYNQAVQSLEAAHSQSDRLCVLGEKLGELRAAATHNRHAIEKFSPILCGYSDGASAAASSVMSLVAGAGQTSRQALSTLSHSLSDDREKAIEEMDKCIEAVRSGMSHLMGAATQAETGVAEKTARMGQRIGGETSSIRSSVCGVVECVGVESTAVAEAAQKARDVAEQMEQYNRHEFSERKERAMATREEHSRRLTEAHTIRKTMKQQHDNMMAAMQATLNRAQSELAAYAEQCALLSTQMEQAAEEQEQWAGEVEEKERAAVEVAEQETRGLLDEVEECVEQMAAAGETIKTSVDHHCTSMIASCTAVDEAVTETSGLLHGVMASLSSTVSSGASEATACTESSCQLGRQMWCAVAERAEQTRQCVEQSTVREEEQVKKEVEKATAARGEMAAAFETVEQGWKEEGDQEPPFDSPSLLPEIRPMSHMQKLIKKAHKHMDSENAGASLKTRESMLLTASNVLSPKTLRTRARMDTLDEDEEDNKSPSANSTAPTPFVDLTNA